MGSGRQSKAGVCSLWKAQKLHNYWVTPLSPMSLSRGTHKTSQQRMGQSLLHSIMVGLSTFSLFHRRGGTNPVFSMDRQVNLTYIFKKKVKSCAGLAPQAPRHSQCNLCYLISKIKQLNSLGLVLLNNTYTTFTMIWAERFSIKENCPSFITSQCWAITFNKKNTVGFRKSKIRVRLMLTWKQSEISILNCPKQWSSLNSSFIS